MREKELRQIYDSLTERLFEIIGEHTYEEATFRTKLSAFKQGERKYFRETVERIIRESGSDIAYTELKLAPNKWKSCEMCGRIFYDMSGNGRTTVCHYETYRWFNSKTRKMEYRYKAGRAISECEKIRDDLSSYGESRYNGSALSYSAETRRQMEERMFIPYSPGVEALINPKVKQKAASVKVDEWSEGNGRGFDYYYRHIRKSELGGQSGAVETFNINDLSSEEIKTKNLQRYCK
jgi:hypothetical protein